MGVGRGVGTGVGVGEGVGAGVGDGVDVGGAAAGWATVYVCPAIVTAPVRSGPAFAAADSTTVPFPFPLWPDWMAIQFAALVAVQAQPASVVTSTDSRPPAGSTVSADRLRPKRQGAAAWLTGTRASSTMIAPERVDGAGFAATVNATDPAPCPLVVESATHEASADADQVQSRVAETAIDPRPPVAGKGDGCPPISI